MEEGNGIQEKLGRQWRRLNVLGRILGYICRQNSGPAVLIRGY